MTENVVDCSKASLITVKILLRFLTEKRLLHFVYIFIEFSELRL
jgi:hypothetical protein